MKESLTKRVSRIVSGSFNSIVGAIENAVPETVMEEAIREIDGAIDEVRAELGKVIANKHLANNRLMDENKKHEDLSEKIELAIAEGRDDLAETAIAQQLDIEAQIPILEGTIGDSGVQEKELEGYISALQAKKRQMNDDLRLFRESQKEAQKTAVAATGASGSGSVESRVGKAESAFERVMEKATGVSPAGSIGDRKTAAEMAELEDMARKNRIQERLAAVKGRVTQGAK